MSFPALPSWDALHPLVVHFPVALLLVAPLFVLGGLVIRRFERGFLLAALALMVMGTVAAWVAVATGEAAGELATRTPAVRAALERHEELAETTRTLFTALTLTFALLLFLPGILRRTPSAVVRNVAGGVFLVGWFAGAGVLANTAHAGGQLVHVYGVHAVMTADGPAAAATEQGSGLLEAIDAAEKDDD